MEGPLPLHSRKKQIATGTLEDGQIVVDCSEKGTVELVFNNVNITVQGEFTGLDRKTAKTKTLIVLGRRYAESRYTDGCSGLYL